MSTHCSAAEAAARLGVSRATLYAYVSRGLIRSEAGAEAHARRYRVDDVERLVHRKTARQDPGRVAAEALQWGAPVLDSALTLIDAGRLYYRGLDAVALSSASTLEAVAGLLWSGELTAALPGVPAPGAIKVPAGLPVLTRLQLALPTAALTDPAAYDLRPAGVQRAGLRILRLLTGLAVERAPATTAVAVQLRRAWRCPERLEPLLEQALVLCADHELNVSAFTVRCVASSGASLYAAINAGVSALQGRRHGGMIDRVADLFTACESAGIANGVQAVLQRDGQVPGFGHPLYPDGDPRATALLASLARFASRIEKGELARSIQRHVARHLGEKPTIDFALAAMTQTLGLPTDAGLIVFTLGRTVGWVGHALEAYARDELIRPRARYTGVQPSKAD